LYNQKTLTQSQDFRNSVNAQPSGGKNQKAKPRPRQKVQGRAKPRQMVAEAKSVKVIQAVKVPRGGIDCCISTTKI